jgi:hypothetical protein
LWLFLQIEIPIGMIVFAPIGFHDQIFPFVKEICDWNTARQTRFSSDRVYAATRVRMVCVPSLPPIRPLLILIRKALIAMNHLIKVFFLDFRLYGHESMNSRLRQFSPQVIAQQIAFGMVKRFSKNFCLDLQRRPGMITTSNMVAL